MQLLGTAVIWDAIDLAALLVASLNETSDNDSNKAIGCQSASIPMITYGVAFSEAPTEAIMPLHVTSTRRKRRTSMMTLTRLNLCLGDFTCSINTVTNCELLLTPCVLSSISKCHTHIARLHAEVRNHMLLIGGSA
jgi:hypothetical protein